MCESITILVPPLNPLVWIQHLAKVRPWLLARDVEYECWVPDPSHSLWFSDGYYIRKFDPLQPRQLHLNNWHIPGLLIIGVIWSTPSETLGYKTYHSSCPDLMSSARFEVTWLNKNIQFISGRLKLIERAVKKSSGPLWLFIMLVKLCYPTGNACVSDNNVIYMRTSQRNATLAWLAKLSKIFNNWDLTNNDINDIEGIYIVNNQSHNLLIGYTLMITLIISHCNKIYI